MHANQSGPRLAQFQPVRPIETVTGMSAEHQKPKPGQSTGSGLRGDGAASRMTAQSSLVVSRNFCNFIVMVLRLLGLPAFPGPRDTVREHGIPHGFRSKFRDWAVEQSETQ